MTLPKQNLPPADRRILNRDTLEQVRACLAEALEELDTLDCDEAARLADDIRYLCAERVRRVPLMVNGRTLASVFPGMSEDVTTRKVVEFGALDAAATALERGVSHERNEEYRAADDRSVA